ncbi:MAG TPA: hypothetical protein VK473_05945 [Terriglobales bacterium]|nr:hypothetical protein [Terriglobales bacterium]
MSALWTAVVILTLAASLGAQTAAPKPTTALPRTATASDSPCAAGGRRQLEEEITEINKDIGGMTARVTMLRSNAGIVQDSAVRSALQIDSDLWLSLIANMRRRAERLQTQLDACDAGKPVTTGEKPPQ